MNVKKGMKSWLLGAAAFVVSFSAVAEGDISVLPYLKTGYTLISAKPAASDVYSVSITGAYGDVIYNSGRISGSEVYSKVFDFSQLYDGAYTVRVKSKSAGAFETSFEVKNGALNTGASENTDVAAEDVKIWSKDDMVFISHLNRYGNDMRVKMEDKSGVVLYNAEIPAELTYSAKFNVATLPKGDYVVSFVSGEDVFNYEFEK
ncbi:hypothetical protein ACT3CD_03485 [Geofilum sp. OHC36d9]|uniref:hypothetical protein n=1 Tax=Geofilum sp. OHC36d9 TaxID=3458413 RepID=UPI004034ACD2